MELVHPVRPHLLFEACAPNKICLSAQDARELIQYINELDRFSTDLETTCK